VLALPAAGSSPKFGRPFLRKPHPGKAFIAFRFPVCSQ